jgi:hypothetical protein
VFRRFYLPEPTTVIKKLKGTIAGFEAKHGIEDAMLPAFQSEDATALAREALTRLSRGHLSNPRVGAPQSESRRRDDLLHGEPIGRLDDSAHRLIVQACEEILDGQHRDMFPMCG